MRKTKRKRHIQIFFYLQLFISSFRPSFVFLLIKLLFLPYFLGIFSQIKPEPAIFFCLSLITDTLNLVCIIFTTRMVREYPYQIPSFCTLPSLITFYLFLHHLSFLHPYHPSIPHTHHPSFTASYLFLHFPTILLAYQHCSLSTYRSVLPTLRNTVLILPTI